MRMLYFVKNLILFSVFSVFVQAWNGHVCTRTVLKYRVENYCNCHRLWWCCGKANRNVGYYTTETICCYGWKHNGDNNCSTPICTPECQNGGKCVNPNTCACAAGYDGDICNGKASCSHLDPCYPGSCSNDLETTTINAVNTPANEPNSTVCTCLEDFSGPTCLMFPPMSRPVIEQSNATFTRIQNHDQSVISRYQADATDKSVVDVTWSNEAEFNRIDCHLHASFDSQSIFGVMPRLPAYIRNTKYGIIDGRFEITHTKQYPNGETNVVNAVNLTCPEARRDMPLAELKCKLDTVNAFQLSSGDVYTLKFQTTSGGYRELVNIDTNNTTGSDYYIGSTTETGIQFRIDYDVPIHCLSKPIDNSPCSNDTAMTLEHDVTTGKIRPKWNGWSDKLSGVSRYVFEVWKLEYCEQEQGLKEPDITTEINPTPLFIKETMADNIVFPEYTPTVPGVYSCILEVNDGANNSEYVRRLVIFDNTTEILTSTTHHLYFASASSSSDFTWQTEYNENKTTQIDVKWDGHFINRVHEDRHFLAKVLKYKPRLTDPNNPLRHEYKRILDHYDDNAGLRTKAAIPNINSIVKFEIVLGNITSLQNVSSMTSWRNILPLEEAYSFELPEKSIIDGDGVQIWIKAHDIMNHTKTDTAVMRFDKTPPKIYKLEIDFNIEDGTFPLTTRITVITVDQHSGLKKLTLDFVLNSTNEHRRPTNDIIVQKQSKIQCPTNPQPDCYCISDDECFKKTFVVDINNCHLTVPVENVDYERYTLHLTSYNQAMLSTAVSKELGSVSRFAGIQRYSSPVNVTIVSQTDISITIKWILLPTCYDRIRNVVVVYSNDNSTKEFFIDKESTEFTIPNLVPSASYDIELHSDYGNKTFFVKSGARKRIFVTTSAAAKVFPQYGFYAIGGGFFFILLVVVVVFVVLGRLGKLQKVKRRAKSRISYWRNTLYDIKQGGNYPQRSNNNRAISTAFEHDVHLLGNKTFEGRPDWYIKKSNLSLQEEITRGRFAIIYKAILNNSRNVEEIVVAKTLHADHTEEQRTQMTAKINFFATKVGHHLNVVEFKGSVLDDIRGPMMILEYCENRTLKMYLDTLKTCYNHDVCDRLTSIAYGICLGMDYLASREIVHQRLAARNVLLNNLFEAKVAGFGPKQEEEQDNIPVKWVAPECIRSGSNASELSDAWSYGVVLWEIFSLGEIPYPGIKNEEVYRYVKGGERMDCPEFCEKIFYNLMKKCWQYDPNKRYNFRILCDHMRPLFHEGDGDDIYMQQIPNEDLPIVYSTCD